MGPLSGDYASVGQPVFQGIELAVDEANDTGRFPCDIELQAEDSQGDPNQAPPLARGLIESDRLVAIVGPYLSGETLATGRIFSRARIAFITPSATNSTIDDQGYSSFFRAVADDDIQGDVAARYIASLGPERVAIVHDNQDYSKGLADAVQRGLADRARGPFVIDPQETDYSAVVAQVEEVDPQVVFYGGYGAQAGPLLRQLREAGVDALFVSDDGTKNAAFSELAGRHAEGTQVTCPCADPLQIPEAEEFVEAIQATYDRPPGTFAADAYDATQLVFAALDGISETTPVDEIRSEVIQSLHSVEGYQGITKPYTFNEVGQVDIGPEGVWVYEWSDKSGDFVALGPASALINE
jgi:branched-chain amino acid transport system substrate-binding protein